jgi:hypothetical protein
MTGKILLHFAVDVNPANASKGRTLTISERQMNGAFRQASEATR